MFLPVVQSLATERYRYLILDVARDVEKYIKDGKDPEEALDFLLGFYTAVPECQDQIRAVITKALEETKNAPDGAYSTEHI